MSLGRASIFSNSTKARNEQSHVISSTGIQTEFDRSSVEGMDVFMQISLIIMCVSARLFFINLIKS